MHRAYLIINPTAGAGKTKKQWPFIKEYLKKIGYDFEGQETEAPGHAIELAAEAVKKGYKYIIAVGGDGTVSEIVNGLYKADGLNSVTLGIISTGTGADYIRTIGIPCDYEEASNKLINPVTRDVDVGLVECLKDGKATSRLFVNFAGLGFDAEVVKATTQKFKAMGRVSAYLLGLLSTLLSYKNKEVDIIIGDEKKRRRICTVIMGNGKYGGGGMYTTPKAEIDDGLLDILIVGDLSKPDFIQSLPTLYEGTHLNHPKVSLKKAAEVTVIPVVPMAVQADGDLVGESPATFKIIEQKLHLIV
jgi:diacylglycerol kinase (ATP)